ncbi:hypothetical protein EYR40_009197 [Pleurotus pulmonarius]|nr:hypothetical protein EYR36_005436 [Pleurotus pulmonarius]KAF4590602.1 hypothetical protein EYR40_009197 [Pleurotus pulmonarius]
MHTWVLNIPPNSRSDSAIFERPLRVTNLALGSVIEGKGRCAVDIHIGRDGEDDFRVCHLGALTPGKIEHFGLDLILDADTETVFLNHGGESSVCLSGYFMPDTSTQGPSLGSRSGTPSRLRADSVDSVAAALLRTDSMESLTSVVAQTRSRGTAPLGRRNSSLSSMSFHPIEPSKPAVKGRKRKADAVTDAKTSTLQPKRKPVTRSGSATIPSARATTATASAGAVDAAPPAAAAAVAAPAIGTVAPAAAPSTASGTPTTVAVATVAVATPAVAFTLPNGVKCTEESMGEITGPAVRVGDDVEIYFVMSLPGSEGVPWLDVRWVKPPMRATFKFTVGDSAIIEGLNTGIVGMHRLGERHIEIPAALAFKKTIPEKGFVYSARGEGVIPLGTKILMRVKLCYIVPGTA